MKKVISVMVILAVFSTTLFAAPVSIAGSLDKQSNEVSRTELSAKADALNDFDDLFVDLHAVALTPEEAQAVEGEGLFGAIIGAIAGGVVGLGSGLITGVVADNLVDGIIGGVLGGATVGAIGGGIF